MCWTSREENKKIAKNSLTVYKVLIPISKDTARSPFYYYVYQRGKLNTPIKINTYRESNILGGRIINGAYKVDEGYHAYSNMEHAYSNMIAARVSKVCELYEMNIPEGTTYYESDIYPYETVSENIVMVRRITYNGIARTPFRVNLICLLEKIKAFVNIKLYERNN